MRMTWLRTWWPRLVAGVVVLVVLAPAAIASYLHANHVVARHDQTMAPWLPLTTDGLLAAALVVIWAKRATTHAASRWIWAAFWTGMVATLAANLAAVLPTTPTGLVVEAIVVAVWPPITVAITLELAAILVMPSRPAPPVLQGPPAPPAGAPAQLEEPTVTQSPSDDAAPPPPPEGPPVSLSKRQTDTPVQTLEQELAELVAAGRGRPTILAELQPRYPELTEDRARVLIRDAKAALNGASR